MSTADERRAHRRQFLEATGWFDAAWYSRAVEVPAGVEPLDHWLDVGSASGLGPNAAIDVLSRPGVLDLAPVEEEPATADPSRSCPSTRRGCSRPRSRCFTAPGTSTSATTSRQRRRGQVQLRPREPFRPVRWLSCAARAPTSTCGGTGPTTSTRAADSINPLVHYALVGRARGSRRCRRTTRPAPERTSVATERSRRVCLFAGYDSDGVVDDSVWRTSRLSRFADVYYLADGHLEAAELAKLAQYHARAPGRSRTAPTTSGRWSMLARDLVGWDVIDDLRRAAARQRQLLPAAAARRRVRLDGRPDLRLVGPAGHEGLRRPGRPNGFTEQIPLDEVKRDLLGRTRMNRPTTSTWAPTSWPSAAT